MLLTLPCTLGATQLRQLQGADLPRFHAYRSNPALARYQGWQPMSITEADAFLVQMQQVSHLQAGHWVQLAIASAPSSLLVGDIGLFVSRDASNAELGFTLHHAHHGQGHASRAVQLALQLLFDIPSITLVEAVSDARNAPSINVLTRNGFRLARQQPAYFKGEHCTELVYQCLRAGG